MRTIVVAVSIAVLAGCGAQPNQAHPTSTWASSYCTALNDWVTTVDAVSRGFVIEPEQSATIDITDLETISKQISQAGNTLTDALGRTGRPQTAGAAQVQATIARLSSSVKRHANEVTRAAKANDRSALAGFRRLHAVTGATDQTLRDIAAADIRIRQQDRRLAAALNASRACRDLHNDIRHGTRRGNQ